MKLKPTKPVTLNLSAFKWDPLSPEEGIPECTCAFCGLVIGSQEGCGDPDCIGCEKCDTALRIFRQPSAEFPHGAELRFHTVCFNLLLKDGAA